MAPNAKRVFYVKYLSGPIFGADPGEAARHPARQAGERDAGCGSRTDPVAGARVSDRRIASGDRQAPSGDRCAAGEDAQSGRGVVERRRLRHDRCRCLHAAGHHRGEPVGRQQGGGGRARAGDAADAVEADHRGRSPHAPRARHSTQRRTSAPSCWTRRSASSASAMSAAGWRSCARACSACACWPTTRICRRAQIAAKGAEKVETLDDMLRQADYVSVNAPYTQRDEEHDGRARVRADAEARLFRHHRARRHPRRGRVGRGADGEADRRCRAGCVGGRTAAARPQADGVRQRAGQSAHRRRDVSSRATTWRGSRPSS